MSAELRVSIVWIVAFTHVGEPTMVGAYDAKDKASVAMKTHRKAWFGHHGNLVPTWDGEQMIPPRMPIWTICREEVQ